MDTHIGYLFFGESKDWEVSCLECEGHHGVPENAAKLYEVNIQPYNQTCHLCGEQIVVGGKGWCELFPNRTEDDNA